MARLTEDDVRWLRQRMVALEQGRLADAEAIEHYLIADRDVRFEDVDRGGVSADFLAYWQVPSSVQRMSLLLDYGREPVFRIPQHMNLAPPFPVGCFEVPSRLVPDVVGAFRPEGFYIAPAEVPVAEPAVEPEPAPAERSLLDRILGR